MTHTNKITYLINTGIIEYKLNHWGIFPHLQSTISMNQPGKLCVIITKLPGIQSQIMTNLYLCVMLLFMATEYINKFTEGESVTIT